MRKEKEVRIDDHLYHVYEIRPVDLVKIYSRAKDEGDIKSALTEDLLPLLTDMTVDNLESMYPSDIEIAYEALKEVNSAFYKRLLGLAQHPEVKNILNELSKGFLAEFNGISADLFNQDTESPKTTVGDSS